MTTLADERVIELFAAGGGMSEALALLGIEPHQAMGVEWDLDACRTAEAAGHRRLQADVAKCDPRRVARDAFGLARVTGFHASPPCQGFSMAGSGRGRQDAAELLCAISMIEDGHEVSEAINYLKRVANDERTALTLEVLRWIADLQPEWITLEQVPAVLPIWEAMGKVLAKWGYSVATGNLHAEQYGVPQTRKRAILIASRKHEVCLPTPTHSRYYSRSPQRLDPGVLPWVSMAEALRWGMTERPYPTIAAGTAAGGTDPQAIGGSGARKTIATERAEGRWIDKTWSDTPGAEEPNPHLAHLPEGVMLCPTNLRPNAALRSLDKPAPTMAFGHETPRWVSPEELAAYRARVAAKAAERENNQSGTKFDLAWPADRPAPTIAGRDIVTMPGANANRFNGSTKSRNDGLRVTIEEAAVLQSFPANYPWAGGKTSSFQQCGNAVPPLLGLAVAKCAVEWASVTEQPTAAAA